MPRSPLVVKNGSRQRRRVSSSMPTPESTTSSCTVSRGAARPHGQRAAVRHRVDGVEDEVGQRIANLAFLPEDGGERLLQLGAHRDRDSALLRQVAPAHARQLDHLRDDRVQVDLRRAPTGRSCGR